MDTDIFIKAAWVTFTLFLVTIITLVILALGAK